MLPLWKDEEENKEEAARGGFEDARREAATREMVMELLLLLHGRPLQDMREAWHATRRNMRKVKVGGNKGVELIEYYILCASSW